MAKKDRPTAFLLDAAAFIGDDKVCLMTPAARGAYIVLMCRAYLRTPPASLPTDDKALAKLADIALDDWLEVKSSVLACWEQQGDLYVHHRLRESYEFAAASRRKRSEAGKKGAEQRWQSDSNANGNASYSSGSSFGSPSTSSSGESEGAGDGEAEAAVRTGGQARSRLQHAYAKVQPAGVKSGEVTRALPEAVRRVQAEWGLTPAQALERIADRAAEYADSRFAASTPLQYRPRLARWLDVHVLDPPEAWRAEYGGNGQPVIVPTKLKGKR